MRMSLMFAAVTLLTGINLFFIPFQPVPALWGANGSACCDRSGRAAFTVPAIKLPALCRATPFRARALRRCGGYLLTLAEEERALEARDVLMSELAANDC